MKRILLLLFILTIKITVAQNAVAGIYLSANDYLNGKLSYASSEKIKLKTFFNKPYLTIDTGNSTIKLYKDSIFGYRDNNKNDYRFNKADERAYRIVENKSKVIYIADVPVLNSKGNAIQLVPKYIYSNALTTTIQPLTINK